MLSLGLAGRYVVYVVVCEKCNLLESEVGTLKPWNVLDWFGLRAHGNGPPTFPPKAALALWSAHHFISRLYVLHVALLQINPTSFKDWMPRSMSMKRYVRNNLFALQSSPSESRPKDNRGTKGFSIRRCWYSDTTHLTRRAIVFNCNSSLNTTKQPDKLPQQRIPHWPLNATAWFGVGRKARKT